MKTAHAPGAVTYGDIGKPDHQVLPALKPFYLTLRRSTICCIGKSVAGELLHLVW